MFRKQIVLVWKQEGHGAVASFGQFFADCGAVVDDDDGAGLQQVHPKTAMRLAYVNIVRARHWKLLDDKVAQKFEAEFCRTPQARCKNFRCRAQ
jgi:hypothetical protein